MKNKYKKIIELLEDLKDVFTWLVIVYIWFGVGHYLHYNVNQLTADILIYSGLIAITLILITKILK